MPMLEIPLISGEWSHLLNSPLMSYKCNISFSLRQQRVESSKVACGPNDFFQPTYNFHTCNEKHKEVSCKSRVYNRLIHNLSVKKVRQVLTNLCTSYRRGKCTPFPFKCSWSLHYYSWLKKNYSEGCGSWFSQYPIFQVPHKNTSELPESCSFWKPGMTNPQRISHVFTTASLFYR